MGKGQATEQEITSGLRAVGSLGNLGAIRGLRRDSPLASAPNERPSPVIMSPRPPIPSTDSSSVADDPKVVDSPGRSSLPLDARTDAVTVPMTADMRSKATLLAAELQRRRTTKAARLTANSIFRVAIQNFLEHADLATLAAVNSEEELLELIRRLWRPSSSRAG